MPLAALEAVKEPLGKVARVLMEICSYAGQQWVVITEHTHTHTSPLLLLSSVHLVHVWTLGEIMKSIIRWGSLSWLAYK